jgi:hypothetical protein
MGSIYSQSTRSTGALGSQTLSRTFLKNLLQEVCFKESADTLARPVSNAKVSPQVLGKILLKICY